MGDIARRLVFLVPALIAFCLGATANIDAPGVYMDAVNPDYIVVRLLNPTTVPVMVWSLPGTLLFGRFPLLGQIYHGALPFYVGLPTYALFGTGLVGIRLTNMAFGCLVLASAGLLMAAFRVRLAIAGFCLCLLALDPAFLFSFRTQFYITMLASAPLFLSIALVERRGRSASAQTAMLAGLLAGLSCYGYFIYGFLAPVAAVHAWVWWRRMPDAKRRSRMWAAGFALGLSPYGFAVPLMLLNLGSHRFADFISSYFSVLHVANSPLTIGQRFMFFAQMLRGTLLDVGPSTVMLGDAMPIYAPRLKLALLLDFPGLALAVGLLGARSRRAATPALSGLATIAGMIAGLLVMVLLFGNRLWMQHAVFLLPALYAALALSLEGLAASLTPVSRRVAGLASIVILFPLLATNIVDRLAVLQRLRVTGGVGLASDATTHFAEDSMRISAPTYMFFPDWGLSLPFAMLTHGSIPYAMSFDPDQGRRVLCANKDAVVATLADQPQARLDEWTRGVAWGVPERRTYDQRTGEPVLVVSRWRAAERPAGACR